MAYYGRNKTLDHVGKDLEFGGKFSCKMSAGAQNLVWLMLVKRLAHKILIKATFRTSVRVPEMPTPVK